MGIRNWRWWHWLLVSLLVGGGLGLVFTSQSVDDPSMQSVSWNEMRRKIDRLTDSGDSVVTKIRVSPVIPDHNGHPVQAVTFWERLRNKSTQKWDPVRQFRLVTPVPLSPTSPTKTFGVLDYLAMRKADIKTLDWRYEWWLAPRTMWAICMGGSVLLIGVLWPIALKGLVKVGLAEAPDERMDLSAVRTAKKEEKVEVKSTADDARKLDDLNAALEANVAGMTVGSNTPAEAREHRPAVPEIRKLGGTGVEEPVAAKAKGDDEEHEFRGEFYPVDHVKRKPPQKPH